MYIIFAVQEVPIILSNLAHKQFSESFQLNAFTLDYCELKIKVLYANVQTCGTTQATRRNSSNFQILFDCIVI